MSLPASAAATRRSVVLAVSLALLPSLASARTLLDLAPPTLHLRVVDLVFAGIFLAAGIAACAMYVAWRSTGERTLFWIGAAALSYGVRLLAISPLPTFGLSDIAAGYLDATLTYFLPLTFLCVSEEILGAGWLSTIRWMRRTQTAYIVIAIAIDAFTHPGAARGPTGTLVLIAVAIVIVNAAIVLARGSVIRLRDLRATSDVVLIGTSTLICFLFVIDENLVSMQLVPWRLSYEPLGVVIVLSTYAFVYMRRLLSRDVQLAALTLELQTARSIQKSLLPRTLPELHGLDIAARYIPAAEVGGDFYDFVTFDETRVGVLIVDVAGHGVPAALVASMVKVAFRGEQRHALNPGRLLGGIRDQLLAAAIERRLVTAAYVVVDTASSTLQFSSAGHPPAMLCDARGNVVELAAPAPPLGAFRGVRYANSAVTRSPASRLVLYSDGIIEAASPAGEPFGSERLASTIVSTRALAADDASQQMLDAVNAWCARDVNAQLEDDVTLVVIDLA
jgi:hypothetical protein